jgi:hypothetical protein
VGGRNLTASDNIYQFFESKAGKQVVIKVGPNPDGTGSREVTVVPAGSEHGIAQSGLDRRQSPQSGSIERRQTGLHATCRIQAAADTPASTATSFRK